MVVVMIVAMAMGIMHDVLVSTDYRFTVPGIRRYVRHAPKQQPPGDTKTWCSLFTMCRSGLAVKKAHGAILW